MFGYVKTDIPNMYVKDTVLYKAIYCGLCKSIGSCSGLRCRFTLSYDLAFLSVLLHNVCNLDVEMSKQHCIVHPFKKRPMTDVTPLSKRIGAFNVILAHYKLCDDVIDNGKGRIKRSFIKSGYKKVKKLEPKLDKIVAGNYEELRRYEQNNCDSIDMICDPFGNIIKDAVIELTGEHFTEELGQLSYHIGKWIYLIDAIDDFEKDVKKKNYNVFNKMCPDIKLKKDLLQEKGQEIVSVLSDTLGIIEELSKALKYNFNHDLTDNIMRLGLKDQTKKIMEKKE